MNHLELDKCEHEYNRLWMELSALSSSLRGPVALKHIQKGLVFFSLGCPRQMWKHDKKSTYGHATLGFILFICMPMQSVAKMSNLHTNTLPADKMHPLSKGLLSETEIADTLSHETPIIGAMAHSKKCLKHSFLHSIVF